ncbi:TPA: hypothetical protein NGU08_004449 [Vibrio parahaemolyticus]|nr:hypothetical protein [Vibrio parahaemolyticus]
MVDHKSIHHVVLLVVVCSSVALFYFYPEFSQSNLVTFSTLGGIVTFYSLVFAVVELLRTKGVAQKAATRVENLYAVKDLSMCQSALETALVAIEKNEAIQSNTLCNIVKVYSHVFHEKLEDVNSQHRHAKSFLDSYSFASKSRLNGTSTNKNSNQNKLRESLMLMLEHISSEIAKTTKDK